MCASIWLLQGRWCTLWLSSQGTGLGRSEHLDRRRRRHAAGRPLAGAVGGQATPRPPQPSLQPSGTVAVEPGVPDEAIAELRRREHQVVRYGGRHGRPLGHPDPPGDRQATRRDRRPRGPSGHGLVSGRVAPELTLHTDQAGSAQVRAADAPVSQPVPIPALLGPMLGIPHDVSVVTMCLRPRSIGPPASPSPCGLPNADARGRTPSGLRLALAASAATGAPNLVLPCLRRREFSCRMSVGGRDRR